MNRDAALVQPYRCSTCQREAFKDDQGVWRHTGNRRKRCTVTVQVRPQEMRCTCASNYPESWPGTCCPFHEALYPDNTFYGKSHREDWYPCEKVW